MWINPSADLAIVAALFVVISQTIQTVLMDRREMRKSQKAMKEKNKQYREMVSKGNASKEELARVQKEILSFSTKSMKQMPKLMVVNMVVFLPLFGLVHQVFDGTQVALFFPFTLIWDKADWYWYYILCSLIISIFVNKVIDWNETRKEKALEKPQDTIINVESKVVENSAPENNMIENNTTEKKEENTEHAQ